ncbi:MAG TPA: zinc-binding dehydrogenase [Chitinophagales bacterium]|nr:zinc-binding dehydrogenase [Chitinophagales bacterium]
MMKAIVLEENGLILKEVELPKLQSGQAMIKISAAALNRRDQWIREGLYPKIQLPVILGSDACGTVVKVQDDIDSHWIGKRIVINPNIDWGENNKIQSKDYLILGMPTNGTLAEYIVVPIDRLQEAPNHLNDESSAALPLAGLTAYNALINKGELNAHKKVLISGVGGGVAQFAFQFSLALGAPTWVTSSKEEVINQCMKFGAQGGVNYQNPEEIKSLSKSIQGFDIIIDGAGGDGLNTLMGSLASGGKLVLYGATKGLPKTLNLRNIFGNQLSLIGNTMGSDQDFEKMLEFVNQHKIHPIIDKIYPLEKSIDAFDRMKDGLGFGKIVIKIGD